MAEIKITNVDQFNQEFSHGKVLVDFFGQNCGTCKMLAPVLSKFADEHVNEVKVLTAMVEENNDLVETYHVTTTPTLILFENGKEVKRTTGMQNPNQLQALIN